MNHIIPFHFFLNESLPEIKLGSPTSKGTEHEIYSLPNDPNVLVKVGKKEIVDKWVMVFKSNPKIFPKVIDSGVLEDGRGYGIIEKLDTKRVVDEWYQMEMALELVGVVDTDVFEDTIDQVFIDIIFGKRDGNKIYYSLSSDPSSQALYKKWINFLIKAADYLMSNSYGGLDLHRYNFGYDKRGTIKALDI